MSPLRQAADAAGGHELSAALSPAMRAEYIEDMVRQLEHLAAGQDFVRLRGLLRDAREEARRHIFG